MYRGNQQLPPSINKRSIVSPYGYNSSECNYCKLNLNKNTRRSYGFSADQLTVDDYQFLIDRGLRRSGTYIYKPDNAFVDTCCPQYTIRLDVGRFSPSKDNKYTLNRVNKYLLNGIIPNSTDHNNNHETTPPNTTTSSSNTSVNNSNNNNDLIELESQILSVLQSVLNSQPTLTIDHDICKVSINPKKLQKDGYYSFDMARLKKLDTKDPVINEATTNSIINALNQSNVISNKYIVNYVNNHINFKFKDSKLLESIKEKEHQQHQQQQKQQKQSKQSTSNTPTTTTPKHEIKITLEKSEFSEEIFQLFCKYQRTIHDDGDKEKKSFIRFLVDSPLIPVEYDPNGYKTRTGETIQIPSTGFGSFHQHYRLDGKLIAVSVIDILPLCLSSVYFFYDPDYSFLLLGKYSALKDIEWVKNVLHKEASQLQYYYMGYYIHTCQKMKYKATYKPSQLLCPETYKYFDLAESTKLLDKFKYIPFDKSLIDFMEFNQYKTEDEKEDSNNNNNSNQKLPFERLPSYSKQHPESIDSITLLNGTMLLKMTQLKPEFKERFKDLFDDFMDNTMELSKSLIIKF